MGVDCYLIPLRTDMHIPKAQDSRAFRIGQAFVVFVARQCTSNVMTWQSSANQKSSIKCDLKRKVFFATEY